MRRQKSSGPVAVSNDFARVYQMADHPPPARIPGIATFYTGGPSARVERPLTPGDVGGMIGPMWQVILLAIAAPAALFLAICFLLRFIFMQVSGWSRMRARYGSQPPPSGWTIRGESATVGPIRFRRILRMTDAPEGLYMATGGLAPLPAIRIPWEDFASARRAKLYRHDVIELTLSGAMPALQISPGLHSRIRIRLGEAARL